MKGENSMIYRIVRTHEEMYFVEVDAPTKEEALKIAADLEDSDYIPIDQGEYKYMVL
jgi:hypothetical protein